jgi:hypothetical protein
MLNSSGRAKKALAGLSLVVSLPPRNTARVASRRPTLHVSLPRSLDGERIIGNFTPDS